MPSFFLLLSYFSFRLLRKSGNIKLGVVERLVQGKKQEAVEGLDCKNNGEINRIMKTMYSSSKKHMHERICQKNEK